MASANRISKVGNILWLVFGGIWLGLSWIVAGILCCCTIIGLPFGIACFRIARFAFCPYGKKLVQANDVGITTSVVNIGWIILAGFWLYLVSIIAGILWCCTIIGIPLGMACFNIAKVSFAPLGKVIVSK